MHFVQILGRYEDIKPGIQMYIKGARFQGTRGTTNINMHSQEATPAC